MATLPTPHQFAVGEDVTADNLNTYYQGLTFAQAVPICSVYSNALQTTSGTPFTDFPLVMNVSNFDTYNGHSGSRYTAQVAGYYLFTGVVAMADTGSTIEFWSGWHKNGSAIGTQGGPRAPASVSAQPRTWVNADLMIQMAVNDYVEMVVTSNTASQNTAHAAPDLCSWAVMWIHG